MNYYCNCCGNYFEDFLTTCPFCSATNSFFLIDENDCAK